MWNDSTGSQDWLGDYTAAGVSAISFWANNQTGADRNFWISFEGPGGDFVTEAIVLPGNGQWTQYTVDLSSLSYFSGSGGTGNLSDTLGNVSRVAMLADDSSGVGLNINNNLGIVRPGTSVSEIWIDNIEAVPEPATYVLFMGMSMLGYMLKRHSPKRSPKPVI